MSLFRRIAPGQGESRAMTRASFNEVSDIFAPNASAGVPVTQDISLQLTAVFACVRLYGDVVGSLPLVTGYKNGDRVEPIYSVPAWVSRPSQEDTLIEWVHRVTSSLLLDGNAFLAITRDALGEIVELIPLNPLSVNVTRNPTTNRLEYWVAGESKPRSRFDICHIKGLTLPGRDRGCSPIAYARETIGTGLAMDRFGGKYFGNGAHLSGFIKTSKAMTPEELQAFAATWEAGHSGIENAHRPAVLSGGAEWVSLSVSPEDAQFLGTKSYTASAIAAQLFGVPPHMIGETDKSTSWGSGIEAQFRGWLATSLAPFLERIEQALTELLAGRGFVKFNTDALVRPDTTARWAIYRTQIETGAATVNEVRAREDLPPISAEEGGDLRFRPSGLVPLNAPATSAPAPTAEGTAA